MWKCERGGQRSLLVHEKILPMFNTVDMTGWSTVREDDRKIHSRMPHVARGDIVDVTENQI